MADLPNRISQQIAQLKVDCAKFDDAKLLQKNSYMRTKTRLFDDHIFTSKSLLLSDYLEEVEENLSRLPEPEKRRSYQFAIEKIDQQLTAIIRMLKSTSVWQKESNTLRTKPKYQRAVQQIMQSSQELYHELSQNHEFERRLLEMIEVRQSQIASAPHQQAAAINKEILALHARLGRCRKAISATEEKIQRLEKRS